MLDMHLRPEKYLTAEDVGGLVGRDERLVQQMYRAQLIDAAALRRGKVVFSPAEAARWKKWYLEHRNDYEKHLWASEKILAGFFQQCFSCLFLARDLDDVFSRCRRLSPGLRQDFSWQMSFTTFWVIMSLKSGLWRL